MISGRSKEAERIWQEAWKLIQDENEDLESVLKQYPEQAAWLRPELETALWLRQKRRSLAPRPGFAAASRSRLMKRLQTGGAARPAWARHWLAWLSWRWETHKQWASNALAVLLVAQLCVSGVVIAQAAPTWLPGDVPYPIKYSVESVALVVTLDPQKEAQLHIQFAKRRLLEMQALLIEGRYEQIPNTVLNFEGHVRQAILEVGGLAKSDPQEARRLALDLRQVLEAQTRLVALLADFAPPDARLQCKRVAAVAQLGEAAADQVILPGSAAPGEVVWQGW